MIQVTGRKNKGRITSSLSSYFYTYIFVYITVKLGSFNANEEKEKNPDTIEK